MEIAPKSEAQANVSVHALEGGKFTLPERFFVAPLEDPNTKAYVPSLCFLIQHYPPEPSPSSTGGTHSSRDNGNGNGNGIPKSQSQPTKILFDLGLRRDISLYSAPIQAHAESRLPIDTSVDVAASLAAGGMTSDEIDVVILSHVHWDHIGLPADFGKAKFVVGYGSLDLLSGKGKRHGSFSCFEAGIPPEGKKIELEATPVETGPSHRTEKGERLHLSPWKAFSIFPKTIDLFQDSSIYIISAEGHLPGHLNLLCRISTNPTKYVYLAGDACHDRRLLTGEKEIAEWTEEANPDVLCCIHADRDEAKNTLKRIWDAECGRGKELGGEVEVIFAHDAVWEECAKQDQRFFPGKL